MAMSVWDSSRLVFMVGDISLEDMLDRGPGSGPSLEEAVESEGAGPSRDLEVIRGPVQRDNPPRRTGEVYDEAAGGGDGTGSGGRWRTLRAWSR